MISGLQKTEKIERLLTSDSDEDRFDGLAEIKRLCAGAASERMFDCFMQNVVEVVVISGDAAGHFSDSIQELGGEILILYPRKGVPALLKEVQSDNKDRAFGATMAISWIIKIYAPEQLKQIIGEELIKETKSCLEKVLAQDDKDFALQDAIECALTHL